MSTTPHTGPSEARALEVLADEMERDGLSSLARDCREGCSAVLAAPLRAMLAFAAEHATPPPGWRLVPCEPTEAMLEAGEAAPLIALGNGQYREPRPETVWSAMLAAAPDAPAAPTKDESSDVRGMVAIPAGMKSWRGGDDAPEDWDGGVALLRDGTRWTPGHAARWRHDQNAGDIIAYTPKPTPDPMADARTRPDFMGYVDATPEQSSTEEDTSIVQALIRVGFCASAGEAQRLIRGGGAYVNGEKVPSPLCVVRLGDRISAGRKHHATLAATSDHTSGFVATKPVTDGERQARALGRREALEEAARVAEEYPTSVSKPIGQSIAKRIRALANADASAEGRP